MTSSWLYMIIMVALWADTNGSGTPKSSQFIHNEKCFQLIEKYDGNHQELQAIIHLLYSSRQPLSDL